MHNIAELLSKVDAYAQQLGTSRDRLLDVTHISKRTGIEPQRVRALLDGAAPEAEPSEKKAREAFRRKLFQNRLQFLTRTRLNNGREYSLREIEKGTGISFQHIRLLRNGDRSARADHATRLELFFDVPEGWCSLTEGAALTQYLQRMVCEDLPKLAIEDRLRRIHGVSLTLRSTGEGGQVDVLKDLLPALDQVIAQARAQGHVGGGQRRD
ncbi:hypothetical protein ACWCP6_28520 [Streptomyces sp. NPDC002004]